MGGPSYKRWKLRQVLTQYVPEDQSNMRFMPAHFERMRQNFLAGKRKNLPKNFRIVPPLIILWGDSAPVFVPGKKVGRLHVGLEWLFHNAREIFDTVAGPMPEYNATVIQTLLVFRGEDLDARIAVKRF